MEDITERFSELIAQLRIENIPISTIQKTRLFLLDYFAACCAGYKMNREFNRACEKLLFENAGREESTVLFSDRKLPAGNAAFLNSCYAHGADLDDGSKKAMGHVGAHVISAVFALAEKLHSSENDVLSAVITGYEVYCRIAAAAQPGMVHRGFHSTGTAGTIACAAACGKLLHMDKEKIHHTIFVSATQSAGLLIVGESGQGVKPINPARAAQNGVQSALLVQYGATGGRYPLESKKGWLHAMAEEVNVSALFEDFGRKYAVDECYMKRFPSCRHTHGAIDAALELRNVSDVNNIKEIRIYIYENAIRLAGSIIQPVNGDEAKFSIHYAVACALLKGRFGLDEIMNVERGDSLSALLDKIQLIPDSKLEDIGNGIRGTRLEAENYDGQVWEKTVLVPKGDPENPFTKEEVVEKFISCGGELLTAETMDKMIGVVLNFGGEREFSYLNMQEEMYGKTNETDTRHHDFRAAGV